MIAAEQVQTDFEIERQEKLTHLAKRIHARMPDMSVDEIERKIQGILECMDDNKRT